MAGLNSVYKLLSESKSEDIFIYFPQRNYTYKEAVKKAGVYSAYLESIKPESKYIAIISDNNPDVIFLILALWNSGFIPVMINNKLKPSEISFQTNAAGCSHIFFSNVELSRVLEKSSTLFPLVSESTYSNKKFKQDLDDAAVIVYTSGSSGTPKGVKLSFRALTDAAMIQNNFLKHSPGNKWAATLPFYHIGGFSIVTRSLLNRSSIVIPASLKAGDIELILEKHNPQFLSLVGSQLADLMKINSAPPPGLKNILLGGGFTDVKIITEALEKGWNISSVYGSSETAAFVTAASKGDLIKYPATSGKELVKDTVYILDEHRRILPSGKEGEIALKGLPFFTKYINDPGSTKQKFQDDFFLTGDIGYKNEEGYLFISMRRSDLIISGGENIDPKEIEKALMEIEGIKDAYIFAVPDSRWGQIPAAAVVKIDDLTEEKIKEILKQRIAGYKIPGKFYFLEELPRNEMGKIRFDLLKELIIP